MKAGWAAWKPYLYIIAGLAAAFTLSHPSGVVGGMLLAAAGIAIWARLSKSGSRSGIALERSSAVNKTSIATAPSYYNDQSG